MVAIPACWRCEKDYSVYKLNGAKYDLLVALISVMHKKTRWLVASGFFISSVISFALCVERKKYRYGLYTVVK